jgi:hypothetical protein
MYKQAFLILLLFFIFGSKTFAKNFTKDELIRNVNRVIFRCREIIRPIDNKPYSLWVPQISFFDFSNKRKLNELKRKLPFKRYLEYINDLKIRTGAERIRLKKKIIYWQDDLHGLNLAVSKDLQAFSSYCYGPVLIIHGYLNELEDLNLSILNSHLFNLIDIASFNFITSLGN